MLPCRRGSGSRSDSWAWWAHRPAGPAEYYADATDDASEAIEWTMPVDRFVDALPLLVLTTASLRFAAALHPDGDWNVRRFRPNLLVDVAGDGWIEDRWCAGASLRIGAVELRPQQPCIRCTMVTRPQPNLDADPTSSERSPDTTAAASARGRPSRPGGW